MYHNFLEHVLECDISFLIRSILLRTEELSCPKKEPFSDIEKKICQSLYQLLIEIKFEPDFSQDSCFRLIILDAKALIPREM